MLPAEQVGDAFAFDLMTEMPDDPAVEVFADYMLNTYVDVDATFPPALWAAAPTPDNYVPRTTNACEAYHRHLKQAFNNASPNIFEFSKTICMLQEENYVRLQDMSATRQTHATDADKKVSLVDNYTQYCNKDISRNEYMSKICYRYLPVNS